MDLEILTDIGHSLHRIKLYPYFDMANYILMSLAVRDDTPQTGSPLFSRKHPFACWLSTMLMCFAGPLLANFLMGKSLIEPFADQNSLVLATIIWYVINYAPFDIVYKFARILPVKLVVCIFKEVQRAKKILHGVSAAHKLYPNAFVACLAIGVVKGSGYTEVKMLERLVRGIWLPASNEFLKPSFTTKSTCAVAALFLLEKMQIIGTPISQLFLGAVIFLVYFRISSLILGIQDPFAPFENLFCAVFMGGLIDALQRARQPQSTGGVGGGTGGAGSPLASSVPGGAAGPGGVGGQSTVAGVTGTGGGVVGGGGSSGVGGGVMSLGGGGPASGGGSGAASGAAAGQISATPADKKNV